MLKWRKAIFKLINLMWVVWLRATHQVWDYKDNKCLVDPSAPESQVLTVLQVPNVTYFWSICGSVVIMSVNLFQKCFSSLKKTKTTPPPHAQKPTKQQKTNNQKKPHTSLSARTAVSVPSSILLLQQGFGWPGLCRVLLVQVPFLVLVSTEAWLWWATVSFYPSMTVCTAESLWESLGLFFHVRDSVGLLEFQIWIMCLVEN